ncbi:MAG: ABC transporter ATP-binding protein [Dehalococcoidia bacterium]
MVTMLVAEHVGKRYGDAAVLDDVSLRLDGGEVLALVGANGAGKSTLIKCVLGLIRHSGTVHVGGVDAARNGKAARRLTGYLPQNPAFHLDLTVRETAIFYADLKSVAHERARAGVEAVGLAEHEDKLVGALSGGMRQRLGLAVALLADPPLLVLDEPGAGLDISARLELRHLVQEQRARGTAVLLSTHWLEDVPYIADRVLVLERGRVASYGPASEVDLLRQPTSRLYLRLNGHSPQAIPLISRLFPDDPVSTAGDWIVVSCAATRKARVVEAVVGAGISIVDIRVEEGTADHAPAEGSAR